MKHFIKYRITDFVLASLMTISVMYAVLSGFLLDENGWYYNPAAVAVTALVQQLVLMFLSYNRITTWIGVAAGIMILAAAIILMNVYSPLTNETDNSMFIYFLAAVVISVMVFLLSRSRAGMIVLFIVGLLLTAGAEFLKWPEPTWSFVLFPVSAAAMFIYRVYQISLKSVRLGQIKLLRYVLQTGIAAVLALAVAFALFFGVVKKINPPTMELKLLEQLESMDILQVLGVSSIKEILLPTESSAELPDQQEIDNAEEDREEESETERDEDTPKSLEEVLDMAAVTYERSLKQWLWLLLLIPAGFIAAFVIRVILKKKKRRDIGQMSGPDAVREYYSYFVKCLSKAGIKKPADRTIREFTKAQERNLSKFDTEGATFAGLSEVYERVTYGKLGVSDSERESFERFADGFMKNLRKYVGTFRYYIWVFRF